MLQQLVSLLFYSLPSLQLIIPKNLSMVLVVGVTAWLLQPPLGGDRGRWGMGLGCERRHLLLVFVIALFHTPLASRVSSCCNSIWSHSKGSFLASQMWMLCTYTGEVAVVARAHSFAKPCGAVFIVCATWHSSIAFSFSSFPRKEETGASGPE